MTTIKTVAGVVLVGGQSLRMGQEKALLDFKGRPLYAHMQMLLNSSGVVEIFFSGQIAGIKKCIPDNHPHQGPGRALGHVLTELHGRFSHLLVVAIDTPLLTSALLSQLLASDTPCYYDNHPLPALLECTPPVSDPRSVYALLNSQNATCIHLPVSDEVLLNGANTPEEWEQLKNLSL
jgi:molybdopterin-guanine dinucleotide biosynthesis protein A